jgi:enoyl-CoA hydratase/carnithine racemase
MMTPPLLERRLGRLAVFTLNAEASLNALTLEMIEALTPRLIEAERDPEVAAVWLEGAGAKAFCAGGDVRRLRAAVVAKDFAWTDDFFEKEYRLDYLIHVYHKPLLVWGHGIVMGGGLGLLAGASHPFVTEKTKLAMPEITIGLYPDVGATSFLRRLPAGAALFLALTGARLEAGDALIAGLGNAFVPSESKDALLNELKHAPFEASSSATANRQLVNEILRRFERAPVLPRELPLRLALLEEAAAAPTLAEYVARLEAVAAKGDEWIAGALRNLRAGSPTSAAVIFELMRRTRGWKLEEGFALDLTLTCQFARHADLPEGVRALLIDKDNAPHWSPARAEDVTAAHVERHFQWIGGDEHPHPFGLDGDRLRATARTARPPRQEALV